jgi:hypothetical protein
VIGSGAHGAFEHNFKEKIKSGNDEPLSVLQDVAATTYRERLENGGVFVAPEDLPSAKIDLAAGKDTAVSLCKPFREDFAPTVQPALVEHKLILDVPELPTLVGFLDLYTVNKRLSDSKTSKKRWSQADADASTQMTLYPRMIKEETGEFPTRTTIDQFIKRKVPAYEMTETTWHPENFDMLINRFKMMLAQIQAGLFPPAQPGSWWCSRKWCGYWSSCKFISPHKRLLPKRSE